jgi:hypothetical protein
LNINIKLLYQWQKEAFTPMGSELDPATAAELRHLRAMNWRQAQELEILKKLLLQTRYLTDTGPMSRLLIFARDAPLANWVLSLPRS